MENDLMTSTGTAVPAARVEQNGEKNIYVDNNGTVIINSSRPREKSISAATLRAIKRFSKSYYQLIVTDEDIDESTEVTVIADRALTQGMVPPEILERCSGLDEDGIKELLFFPMIVCNKNTGYGGMTDPEQEALYCYIKKIEKGSDGFITVTFSLIDSFPQIMLCGAEAAAAFDLVMDCEKTDLNICGWSVRRVNLFEAFEKVGIEGMPAPM